jgi:hypothetical protein
MKMYGALVLVLFFFLGGILSGCTTTPPEVQGHDSRLIGEWRADRTMEVLIFNNDGTYTISEGETANWSTASGGKLWMFGTLYSYALLENNTVLTITQSEYTRTYRRL